MLSMQDRLELWKKFRNGTLTEAHVNLLRQHRDETRAKADEVQRDPRHNTGPISTLLRNQLWVVINNPHMKRLATNVFSHEEMHNDVLPRLTLQHTGIKPVFRNNRFYIDRGNAQVTIDINAGSLYDVVDAEGSPLFKGAKDFTTFMVKKPYRIVEPKGKIRTLFQHEPIMKPETFSFENNDHKPDKVLVPYFKVQFFVRSSVSNKHQGVRVMTPWSYEIDQFQASSGGLVAFPLYDQFENALKFINDWLLENENKLITFKREFDETTTITQVHNAQFFATTLVGVNFMDGFKENGERTFIVEATVSLKDEKKKIRLRFALPFDRRYYLPVKMTMGNNRGAWTNKIVISQHLCTPSGKIKEVGITSALVDELFNLMNEENVLMPNNYRKKTRGTKFIDALV